MSDTFYFVAFSDKTTLIVIDLDHCVSYERDDWSVVDEENFTTPEEAIAHARNLAIVNGLNYEPFESRYNKSLNEPKLSLTSPRIRRPKEGLPMPDRRIIKAALMINDEEREDLAEWEEIYVATGEYGTIDWPGWEAVIDRIGLR